MFSNEPLQRDTHFDNELCEIYKIYTCQQA